MHNIVIFFGYFIPIIEYYRLIQMLCITNGLENNSDKFIYQSSVVYRFHPDIYLHKKTCYGKYRQVLREYG